MKNNIIYYSDPLNDDFAGTKIKTKPTPNDYKYLHKNIFYRLFAFIIYSIIVKPIVTVYIKIKYHQKFIGQEKLKSYKNKGYFLYGNHTLLDGDAFIPNMISKRKNFIIVGYDTFSIKGIGWLVEMLGAIPLPATFKNTKGFYEVIKYRILKENRHITIYPEAHIWPYYTDIRPFKSASLRYPVQLDTPVFTLTNTFIKSRNKLRKTPKIVTYIDGPFYQNKNLKEKEQIEDLRNRIYETMKNRSKNSTYQYKYEYHYKEKS